HFPGPAHGRRTAAPSKKRLTAVAITRSWTAAASGTDALAPPSVREPRRTDGIAWLAAASLLIAFGLAMTYAAKTMELPETTAKLARGDLLDLNRAPSAEALLPFLNTFPGRDGRELAAARTFAFLEKARPVRNVGALSALRISVAEIESDPRWDTLRRSLPPAGTHPTRVAL